MTETLPGDLPNDVDETVMHVLKSACDQDIMIATAESCTGGLIASLLTDVTGCSHAFDRGFVVYTNDAKNQMLGVPEALLEDPGPVSEEVARAMAEGALAHSNAHLAVSITGFAGPAGPETNPASSTSPSPAATARPPTGWSASVISDAAVSGWNAPGPRCPCCVRRSTPPNRLNSDGRPQTTPTSRRISTAAPSAAAPQKLAKSMWLSAPARSLSERTTRQGMP